MNNYWKWVAGIALALCLGALWDHESRLSKAEVRYEYIIKKLDMIIKLIDPPPVVWPT